MKLLCNTPVMSKRFEKRPQKKFERDVLLKWLLSSILVGPTNWVCFFVFSPTTHPRPHLTTQLVQALLYCSKTVPTRYHSYITWVQTIK